MSLNYEPASAPQNISVKWLFLYHSRPKDLLARTRNESKEEEEKCCAGRIVSARLEKQPALALREPRIPPNHAFLSWV